jgi:hypothetical protein
MIRTVLIQIQDKIGNWVTVQHAHNEMISLARTLDTVSRMYKRRCRAIDSQGHVIDIR